MYPESESEKIRFRATSRRRYSPIPGLNTKEKPRNSNRPPETADDLTDEMPTQILREQTPGDDVKLVSKSDGRNRVLLLHRLLQDWHLKETQG